jgi:hypothetical protein
MWRAIRGWLRDFMPGYDASDLKSALAKIDANSGTGRITVLTHREFEAVRDYDPFNPTSKD